MSFFCSSFPTLSDLAKIVDTVAEGFNTQQEVDQVLYNAIKIS